MVLHTLADNPYLGVACDDVRSNYRKFPVREHIIFYLVNGDTLDIMRVIDSDMDVTLHI